MEIESVGVLVAVDDLARRRVRGALAEYRLTFVQTSRQAVDCLRAEPFGLVLIGSHFDSCRAIRALELVMRAGPACPVVCAATRPFGPAAQCWTYPAFRSACLERGARDTLDLTRWRDDGDGNAHVRTLLHSVLRPEHAQRRA